MEEGGVQTLWAEEPVGHMENGAEGRAWLLLCLCLLLEQLADLGGGNLQWGCPTETWRGLLPCQKYLSQLLDGA